jgi:hypothetical protein
LTDMHHLSKNFTWTQDAVDLLSGYLAEGHTAERIASMMGVSRNTVIGKTRRLQANGKVGGFARGLSFRQIKPASARKSRAKPKDPALAIPKRGPGGWNVTQILTRIAEKAQPAPAPFKPGTFIGPGLDSRHMPKRGKCWYPVNDAAPNELHLFCAAPAELSEKGTPHSYCAGHRALVTAPPKVLKNTRSLKEAMAA